MMHTHYAVKTSGITCIMTTHNLEDALTFGNRLIALKDGKIVFQADYEEKRQLTRQMLLEYY